MEMLLTVSQRHLLSGDSVSISLKKAQNLHGAIKSGGGCIPESSILLKKSFFFKGGSIEVHWKHFFSPHLCSQPLCKHLLPALTKTPVNSLTGAPTPRRAAFYFAKKTVTETLPVK